MNQDHPEQRETAQDIERVQPIAGVGWNGRRDVGVLGSLSRGKCTAP
jgi:hypothetical protein